MTAVVRARTYLDGTQREVKDMGDMLQHPEFYKQEIERHQLESQRWAQAGTLGRLAEGVRTQSREHPRRSGLAALATPIVVALGAFAIII